VPWPPGKNTASKVLASTAAAMWVDWTLACAAGSARKRSTAGSFCPTGLMLPGSSGDHQDFQRWLFLCGGHGQFPSMSLVKKWRLRGAVISTSPGSYFIDD
jgi:hypothetical protein